MPVGCNSSPRIPWPGTPRLQPQAALVFCQGCSTPPLPAERNKRGAFVDPQYTPRNAVQAPPVIHTYRRHTGPQRVVQRSQSPIQVFHNTPASPALSTHLPQMSLANVCTSLVRACGTPHVLAGAASDRLPRRCSGASASRTPLTYGRPSTPPPAHQSLKSVSCSPSRNSSLTTSGSRPPRSSGLVQTAGDWDDAARLPSPIYPHDSRCPISLSATAEACFSAPQLAHLYPSEGRAQALVCHRGWPALARPQPMCVAQSR